MVSAQQSGEKAPRPIIYAEDNEDDFFFFSRAAKSWALISSVIWVKNGAHAKLLLSNNPSLKPLAVITDLKMPICDGYELLKWIRADPRLSDVPVFVWSSSNLLEDAHRSMALGASRYFVKPAFAEYAPILAQIAEAIGQRPGLIRSAAQPQVS